MLGFIFQDASGATKDLLNVECRINLAEQSDTEAKRFLRWLDINEEDGGSAPALVTASSIRLLQWFLQRALGSTFANVIFAVSDRPDVLRSYPGITIVDAELRPTFWQDLMLDAWNRVPRAAWNLTAGVSHAGL